MVEVTLNLGSLEKGSISDSGSKVTSAASVRTANYVTGNDSLYECEVECGIVVKDDIEGSFSGDSSWRNPIPDCPTTFEAVRTDNPNDTCEYYHFVRTCIEPPSQIFPHGRTRQWAGYMINLYPTIGFNHEGNTPNRFMCRGDNEFQSSDAFLKSVSYVSIDMSGDGLITYYKSGTSGETVTKTILEFIFGEKDPDNDDTLSINLEGSRGSKDVPADIALIGYNANNQVVYNKRWVTADVDRPHTENIINYLPIAKWKFVFKNEEYYSDIKTEYILKPKVKLRAHSWEMTQDNILVNYGMCEEISGALFVVPFPASFWRLNSVDMLTLNSEHWSPLPEPDDGPTFQYPYPASLWWYDEVVDRVRNIMIPDELIADPTGGAFYHAENLEYVKIPRSVTSIGQAAFEGTQVKEVCISRNCKYSKSSFPKDCKVIFYEDMYDENYKVVVSGKHSYRYTETETHFEDSVTEENP